LDGMHWDASLVIYDSEARAETYPMYQSTLERVRANLYTEAPEWLTKLGSRTFFRWLFEDNLLQENLGLMLTRRLEPNQVMSAPIVVGAMAKGPLRDFSRFLDKQIERLTP
jgi:hypothetical protein